MALEMYDLQQNETFGSNVNLVSQNFKFTTAYRTFMVLYGHRADK